MPGKHSHFLVSPLPDDSAGPAGAGRCAETEPTRLPEQLALRFEGSWPAAPAREWSLITRYRLRLVAEAKVPYEGHISCEEPDTAADFLHVVLEGLDREVLGALLLDTRLAPLGFTIAYVGTINFAPAEPRGVLVPALLANASAIILFHNHPSGDPTPSRDDEELTRRLVEAGQIVGIKVLDHIILGEAPRFVSLFRRRPW